MKYNKPKVKMLRFRNGTIKVQGEGQIFKGSQYEIHVKVLIVSMIPRVNDFRAAVSAFSNRKETSRTPSLTASVNYLVLIKSHP